MHNVDIVNVLAADKLTAT